MNIQEKVYKKKRFREAGRDDFPHLTFCSIFIAMTDIGKFLSDVEKLKKHDRQNNGGKPDYNRIADDLRRLFERSTSCPGEFPGSIYEYWEKQYIFNSQNIAEEPCRDNLEKLGAMLAFLDNSVMTGKKLEIWLDMRLKIYRLIFCRN